jgi:hypothetical protein
VAVEQAVRDKPLMEPQQLMEYQILVKLEMVVRPYQQPLLGPQLTMLAVAVVVQDLIVTQGQ